MLERLIEKVGSYLALTLVLAAPVAHASVSGTFDSPVGRLELKETEGLITGKLKGKSPCPFKAGQVIFNGTRLDDTVTGSLSVCKVGEGCEGKVDAIAMLLVSPRGTGLSGAVHVEAGQCKTPLAGQELRLRRVNGPGKGTTKATDKGGKKSGKDEKGASSTSGKKGAPDRAGAEAKARRAGTLLSSGDAEGARALFQEAVDLDPDYAEGYVGLGITYYQRDRYDEAERYYKEALDHAPTNPDAFYNIACLYALRGEKDKSLGFLRLAVANGYVQLTTLVEDPDLKGLEGDPRFEALKEGSLDW